MKYYIAGKNKVVTIDRSVQQMQSFWQMVDSVGLTNLGYWETPFTWCNGLSGIDQIFERLARDFC